MVSRKLWSKLEKLQRSHIGEDLPEVMLIGEPDDPIQFRGQIYSSASEFHLQFPSVKLVRLGFEKEAEEWERNRERIRALERGNS